LSQGYHILDFVLHLLFWFISFFTHPSFSICLTGNANLINIILHIAQLKVDFKYPAILLYFTYSFRANLINFEILIRWLYFSFLTYKNYLLSSLYLILVFLFLLHLFTIYLISYSVPLECLYLTERGQRVVNLTFSEVVKGISDLICMRWL